MSERTTTFHDPIVEEVHRIREALLAQFNGDLEALCAEMRRQAAASGIPSITRPPRRPPDWRPPVNENESPVQKPPCETAIS